MIAPDRCNPSAPPIVREVLAHLDANPHVPYALSVCESHLPTIPTTFGRLHTLDLTPVRHYGRARHHMTAVPGLDRLHSLTLTQVDTLVDVSNLGRLTYLNLSGCTSLVNVSALGSVHTLLLCDCTGVRDVSALGKPTQHELRLDRCVNIAEVNNLGGVHTLRLSDCTGVRDVSKLGTCHTLYLDGCTNVTDISALGNVETLISNQAFHHRVVLN